MNPQKFPIVRLALAVLITFSLAVSAQAQSESTLYNFSGTTDGYYPFAGVIADSSGNLYGVAQYGGDLSACGSSGCGAVYKLAPNGSGGWTQTVLHAFVKTDGAYPMGGLLFDNAGNLYGTTENGGAFGNGVVFKLTPNSSGGWDESVLHNFSGYEGAQPRSTLVMDRSGSLYGTATFGGINGGSFSGFGSVYRLTPTTSGSWKMSAIYRFPGGSAGGNPNSGVVLDANGSVYSTAEFGGSTRCNCGVVFKLRLAAGTWNETIIHTFQNKTDGGYPIAPVTLDSAGNIYGTAEFGGTNGVGVVFEFSSFGGVWTETILHDFGAVGDGGSPWAGVTFDSAGNLYGATYNQGASDGGVVYKLTPGSSGWTETVLHSFPLFSTPFSAPLVGSNGNLFGTTSEGGSFSCSSYGCGVVYEISQ